MRKLMIALAAAAIAMTSMGASSTSIYAYVVIPQCKQGEILEETAGWHSVYVMTTDDARALMGTSTFSFEGFNTWLGSSFWANSSLVKENAFAIPFQEIEGVVSGYVFSNNETGRFDEKTTVMAVAFYDVGNPDTMEYYVAGYETPFSSFGLGYIDEWADYKSGWQYVQRSVPEPTSGLLLLLGMAGLALRRSRA